MGSRLKKYRVAGVSLRILWKNLWCLTCEKKSLFFAFKNFPTEVILLSKMLHDLMLQRGVGARRPLLRANEKQMSGQRDFLLARVYVLQHIPFHLLHVSALLWLVLRRAPMQLEPERSHLAGGDGNMWNPFARVLRLAPVLLNP